MLEIYQLRDSAWHTVCMGPNGEPQFQVSQGYGIPTGIMGFGDVQVTDSAIYAVFSGRTFKELVQNAQQGKNLPEGGRYIYAFSLRGEPLCRYALDRHISGFHVDEEKDVRTCFTLCGKIVHFICANRTESVSKEISRILHPNGEVKHS